MSEHRDEWAVHRVWTLASDGSTRISVLLRRLSDGPHFSSTNAGTCLLRITHRYARVSASIDWPSRGTQDLGSWPNWSKR